MRTRSEESRLQEEANEISFYQFLKMNQWGELTSTPTSHCWKAYSGIEDYELKERIAIRLNRAFPATPIRTNSY